MKPGKVIVISGGIGGDRGRGGIGDVVYYLPNF